MVRFRDPEDDEEEEDEEEEDEEAEDYENIFSDDGRGDFALREMRAADRLSFRLLNVQNEEEADRILRQSLRLLKSTYETNEEYDDMILVDDDDDSVQKDMVTAFNRVCTMIVWAAVGFSIVVAAIFLVGKAVGPPNQPVGPYALVERQEGENFFTYYSFYEGPDSVGSNGYLLYVGRQHATEREILNVTYEEDDLDFLYKNGDVSSRRPNEAEGATPTENNRTKKPFIYMGSAPTAAGPRDSIRLEGTRRFNRGLFM